MIPWNGEMSKLTSTAVTNQAPFGKGIDQCVNHGDTTQNGHPPQDALEGKHDDRDGCRHRNRGHAGNVWKISSCIQLAALTHRAADQLTLTVQSLVPVQPN